MNPSQSIALVTGASSGIGHACAKKLADAGYRVFGTSRKPDGPTLDNFEMLPLEVTSDESVAECVRTVADRAGRIDLLLNNVGTGILGAAEESSAGQVDRLFQINVFGGVRMANAALPIMRAQGSGRIIVMGSSGGVASLPFAGYYCATKHALEAYVRALRLELRPLGLFASLIAPGPVATDAGEAAMKPDRPIEAYRADREKAAETFVKAIHDGIAPERVARVVLKAARAKRPKLRYGVGFSSWATSFMASVLPASWFEAGVRRAFGR